MISENQLLLHPRFSHWGAWGIFGLPEGCDGHLPGTRGVMRGGASMVEDTCEPALPHHWQRGMNFTAILSSFHKHKTAHTILKAFGHTSRTAERSAFGIADMSIPYIYIVRAAFICARHNNPHSRLCYGYYTTHKRSCQGKIVYLLQFDKNA